MDKSTDLETGNITFNGVEYVRADSVGPEEVTGDYVIVRSRDAGVHVGRRVGDEHNGVVELENAVRVWRWRGANTLHEMALYGVQTAAESSYTRVSEPVAGITVLGCCEVIPCSDAVAAKIRAAGWAG